MIGPDAFAGVSERLLADVALLAASVFYALSPIYGRRFAAGPDADGRGDRPDRRRRAS